MMIAALFMIGSSEWVREVIRKPFVIGSHMFVNGVRLPPPEGSAAARDNLADPYSIDRLAQSGVLAVAKWTNVPPEFGGGVELTVAQEAQAGREVFRLLCASCHTVDGYLAIRPLVANRSSVAIEGMLDRLALPRGRDGAEAAWSAPGVTLATWRGRRMPPFVGTPQEKRALAVYLAGLGGGEIAKLTPGVPSAAGAAAFESHCAACHGEGSDWPLAPHVAGRSEAEIHDIIGRLPQLNDAMPPFEGTDAERRAIASHLLALGAGGIALSGPVVFDNHCAMCHGDGSDLPLEARFAGRSEADVFDALGRLPEMNDAMPPFEGTEEERRALAKHLLEMTAKGGR
jgi:mono/diheme cytochrome c family protein